MKKLSMFLLLALVAVLFALPAMAVRAGQKGPFCAGLKGPISAGLKGPIVKNLTDHVRQAFCFDASEWQVITR